MKKSFDRLFYHFGCGSGRVRSRRGLEEVDRARAGRPTDAARGASSVATERIRRRGASCVSPKKYAYFLIDGKFVVTLSPGAARLEFCGVSITSLCASMSTCNPTRKSPTASLLGTLPSKLVLRR